MKFSSDLRIEPGAASYQVTHRAAESLMNLPEENSSSVESKPAQHSIQRHQTAHGELHDFATLRNFFEDAFVNEIEKLRDYGERRNLPLAEGAQQVVGIQSFQINDAGSGYKWKQQIRHLSKGMEERQQAKHRILWPNPQYRKNSLDF